MSDEMREITAREAEEILGIPAGSIRAWASRDLIFCSGATKQGAKTYPLKRVIELGASSRRIRSSPRKSRRSLDLNVVRPVS